MNNKFDEIEFVNASSYLQNDLKNIPYAVLDILNKHLNLIVSSRDNDVNFRTYCVDAFEYYKDKPALLTLLIRKITERRVAISYSIVPEFKNVVDEFSPFIRTVRTIF